MLVLPPHGDGPEREHWEIASGDEAHVDFVTDDLAGFLMRIESKDPVGR